MKAFLSKLAIALTFSVSVQSTVDAVENASPAPNCALTALNDNHPVNTGDYRGKVVVLDFWASWCGPCAQAMSYYNELQQSLHGQGLEVLGVNLDTKPGDAQAFLAQHPADFPIMIDAAKLCPQAFQVTAMPSSYFIDRKGIVRHVHLGFRPGEAHTEVRAWVEKLLAEQP